MGLALPLLEAIEFTSSIALEDGSISMGITMMLMAGLRIRLLMMGRVRSDRGRTRIMRMSFRGSSGDLWSMKKMRPRLLI